MRNFLITLFLFVSLSSSAGAVDTRSFDFKVSVPDPNPSGDVEVYGTFGADEGRYGGIEIAFFRAPDTYSIRTLEKMSDVTSMPEGKTHRADEAGIDVVLRLFVSPELTRDGDVHLSGRAMLLHNTTAAGEPLYRITEESFALVVPNGGDTVLTFVALSSGREIEIELSASLKESGGAPSNRNEEYFVSSFSLVNEDERRFEIEDEPCDIRFGPRLTNDGSKCTHRKMFRLANEDSLLYLVSYHLDEISRLEGGSISVTIAVERWFFVNPQQYFTEQVPDGFEGKTYGTGRREIESTISIDGEKRRVKAVIENGTIVKFKWDNIAFTGSDIVRNWNDVVAIMTQVEKNRYLYHPPKVEAAGGRAREGIPRGLIDGPANYTGSKMQSTSYSKSFVVEPNQDIEIDIPVGRKSLLPFNAREIVTLSWSRDSRRR